MQTNFNFVTRLILSLPSTLLVALFIFTASISTAYAQGSESCSQDPPWDAPEGQCWDKDVSSNPANPDEDQCSWILKECSSNDGDDRDDKETHRITVEVVGNGTVTGPRIDCTSSGSSDCTDSTRSSDTRSTWILTADPDSDSEFVGWDREPEDIYADDECVDWGGFLNRNCIEYKYKGECLDWGGFLNESCQDWEGRAPVIGGYCGTHSECRVRTGGSTTVTATFEVANRPPNKPTIQVQGSPNTLYAGEEYTLTFKATDPDGDGVAYFIDGNPYTDVDAVLPSGVTQDGRRWHPLSYVSSGATLTSDITWSTPGYKYIRAYTRDTEHTNSGWTIFTVYVKHPPVDLTVTKDSANRGRVASSPSGIDCGTSCQSDSHTYEHDTPITLSATPNTGGDYLFNRWTGGCSATSTSCSFRITDHSNVKASFYGPYYLNPTIREVGEETTYSFVPNAGLLQNPSCGETGLSPNVRSSNKIFGCTYTSGGEKTATTNISHNGSTISISETVEIYYPRPVIENFSVDPAWIRRDSRGSEGTDAGHSTLNWSVEKAVSCEISTNSEGLTPSFPRGVSTSGSLEVDGVTETTRFTLTCVGEGAAPYGARESSAQAVVNVLPTYEEF